MKETTLSDFLLILHAEFIFAADVLEQHNLAHTVHQAEFFSKSLNLRRHISRNGLQKSSCSSAVHQMFQALLLMLLLSFKLTLGGDVPFSGQWNAADTKGLRISVQSAVLHTSSSVRKTVEANARWSLLGLGPWRAMMRSAQQTRAVSRDGCMSPVRSRGCFPCSVTKPVLTDTRGCVFYRHVVRRFPSMLVNSIWTPMREKA